VNELLEQIERAGVDAPAQPSKPRRRYQLALVVIAVIIFFGCIVSPPGLMDDVDAVHFRTGSSPSAI
jgi:hypothetical protein